MKIVYIMLGVPGSGKSYLANNLAIQSYKSHGWSSVVSADFYYTPKVLLTGGLYGWNPEYINDAHLMCQRQFDMCIKAEVNGIIVDNTNLKYNSIAHYAEKAVMERYQVDIVEPQTVWRYDAEECFKRCQHSVPLETIKTMLSQLQNLKVMHPKMFENPTEYFQDELSIQHTGY